MSEKHGQDEASFKDVDVDVDKQPTSSPPAVTVTAMRYAADATKWTVTVLMVLVVAHYRDRRIFLFAVGSLVNSGCAKLLKKLLQQPRPDGARQHDPGMPSSHAMSLAYLSVGLVLDVLARYTSAVPLLPLALAWAFLVAAVVASCLRVSLGYHTRTQVVVGWIVGVVNCLLWSRVLMPVMF